MTVAADRPEQTSPPRYLRIALIVIAAVEAIGALMGVPGIFYDFNPTTPLEKFAQLLTSADLVVAVPITLAALYFAVAGRLRYAIAAIAIRVLVTWLSDLPSFWIHGIEWSLSYGGISVAGYQIGAPLTALAAIYLARRNERLGLATLLVALPTIFTWLGVLAFAISVMIYGF
jgi:hypothetical protein